VLNATRDLVRPTTIRGPHPRLVWFTEGPHRRSSEEALGDGELGLPEAPVPAADPRVA
jgi:hypothetical protein